MRKLFMIAGALACLTGISSANAQHYYYDDNYYVAEDYYVSPAPSVIISDRPRDCGALREIPNFHAMDSNADGQVSKIEFMHLGTLDDFVSLDLNGNGGLTRGELKEYRRLCD
ncbi:MAG: hypothetical protein ACAH83_19375 [Alphaproteobacteria bacterium]